MNWIAIKDNKPDVGRPVLLYNANIDDAGALNAYVTASLKETNKLLEWENGLGTIQNLNSYTHWMPLPEPPIPQDEQAEAIRMVADSVLSHHLPHDARLQQFSFRITVEGKGYEVIYEKDADGYWAFKSYN